MAGLTAPGLLYLGRPRGKNKENWDLIAFPEPSLFSSIWVPDVWDGAAYIQSRTSFLS